MSQHFLETGQVSNLLEIPPTIAIGHHQLVTPVILGCTDWRLREERSRIKRDCQKSQAWSGVVSNATSAIAVSV